MSKVNLTSIANLDGNPASAASNINSNFSQIQTQLDLFLSRDAEAPNTMEAELDMNSHRIINCADGTLPSDAVTLRQLTDTALDGINITGLPAGAALTGTESVPVLQSGNVVSTTAQAIANLNIIPTLGDLFAKQTFSYGIVDTVNSTYSILRMSQPAESSLSATWDHVPATSMLSALGQRTLTSNAAINSAAYTYNAQHVSDLYRTLTGGGGGFEIVCCFRFTDSRATLKAFFGVTPFNDQLVLTGANQPSNQVNLIAIAKDSTDTNFQFITNDGSGVATKVDTGITPATLAGKSCRFTMTVPIGGATAKVLITNMNTEATLLSATYTLGANVPAADTDLHWLFGLNTGPSVSTALDFAVHKILAMANS